MNRDGLDRFVTALIVGLAGGAVIGLFAFVVTALVLAELASSDAGSDDDFGLILYPLGVAALAGIVGGTYLMRRALRRMDAA